ncbi:oleate hydratase [Gordonia jinhuaensis]|uniref:Oleate hydratase n=1 Tax=Gordonia jinhuaensis TaxID=1517702 RepID=A0A916T0C6_9ACTN|nr:oleate hydratase [Gordonia jinhuaensis]GGB22851.1 oleate hydratase [Gordonia jinhuaensis]
MYYSSGNYEAFARPRKPHGVDGKTAWFVGAGQASLAGAAFLIRDGQMPGDKITILEELKLPGGALDGIKEPKKGFVIRGGREMENHFECLWDLYRSIPSLEVEGASVHEEFYYLNKDDPNYSLQRATINRGEDAHTDGLFTLNDKAQKEILRLFLATREEVEDVRIDEVFTDEFFSSNFWLYWQTMFAFEKWHSALEMKLYIHRFIHHIGGLPDFSALKFTKYNQYESLVLPLYTWLLDQGVKFQFSTVVTDVDFEFDGDKKTATKIHYVSEGVEGSQDLGTNDLLFMTIGSLTENSDEGDHHTPAKLNTGPAPAWDLWRRIAAKHEGFGRPDKFAGDIDKSKWESCTVTTLDPTIPKYIQKICKRDPFSGKVVTGGIVSVRDSSWQMSWTVNRQPHFKQQPKDQIVIWVYGLIVDKPGDYVKKALQDCTGEEITQEWLYHLGVPEADIPELAANSAKAVPCMMPYVTAFFMPRRAGDRPDVVPEGSMNFAFIGQFAESPTRDCIFTTEYSVRTPMEAVYTLLNIERGVPEVFNSTYDVRTLVAATSRLRDGKMVDLPGPKKVREKVLGKLESNQVGELLAEYELIPSVGSTRKIRNDAVDMNGTVAK